MTGKPCPATIEEPGLFSYECELPEGHSGEHVVHWSDYSTKIVDLCPTRYDIPGVVSFLCTLPAGHQEPHRGARDVGPSKTVTP